ncbi:DUF6165 family protein [Xanthobacter sp. AM11]|uniref:DUF6165 family protein n=1 Tax=Xanthobacter sp. AM11 TaxID=3380643 RepID=UPI0039BFCFF8
MGAGDRLILAPVSAGELIDKITILEIKAAHIADAQARANVLRELSLLVSLRDEHGIGPQVAQLTAALAEVNRRLWQVEDDLRACEAEGRFDSAFVELARSVYLQNDRRAALKRQVNLLVGSAIVEEKSHFPAKD